jgi:hypothetical protein
MEIVKTRFTLENSSLELDGVHDPAVTKYQALMPFITFEAVSKLSEYLNTSGKWNPLSGNPPYVSGGGSVWWDNTGKGKEELEPVYFDEFGETPFYETGIWGRFFSVVNDGHAEILHAIEELKKAFLELDNLTGEFHDATEQIFNNGIGQDTYPFSESFEELTANVMNWVTK